MVSLLLLLDRPSCLTGIQWLTLINQHIYLENACEKSFSYPRDDRDDDETQADFPDLDNEDA